MNKSTTERFDDVTRFCEAIGNLAKERDSLRNQVKELEALRDELASKLKDAKTELVERGAQCAVMWEAVQLEEVKARVAELEEQYQSAEELRSEVAEAVKQLREQDHQITQLTQQRAELAAIKATLAWASESVVSAIGPLGNDPMWSVVTDSDKPHSDDHSAPTLFEALVKAEEASK